MFNVELPTGVTKKYVYAKIWLDTYSMHDGKFIYGRMQIYAIIDSIMTNIYTVSTIVLITVATVSNADIVVDSSANRLLAFST